MTVTTRITFIKQKTNLSHITININLYQSPCRVEIWMENKIRQNSDILKLFVSIMGILKLFVMFSF